MRSPLAFEPMNDIPAGMDRALSRSTSAESV